MEDMSVIRRMGLAPIIGLMDVSIWDFGKKENNMEMGSIII